eukprot:g34375.t1
MLVELERYRKVIGLGEALFFLLTHVLVGFDVAFPLLVWRLNMLEQQQVSMGKLFVSRRSPSHGTVYFLIAVVALALWAVDAPGNVLYYLAKHPGSYVYGPPGEGKIDFIGIAMGTEMGLRMVLPVISCFFLCGWAMRQIRVPASTAQSGWLMWGLQYAKVWFIRNALYTALTANVAVGFCLFFVYREMEPLHSFELPRILAQEEQLLRSLKKQDEAEEDDDEEKEEDNEENKEKEEEKPELSARKTGRPVTKTAGRPVHRKKDAAKETQARRTAREQVQQSPARNRNVGAIIRPGWLTNKVMEKAVKPDVKKGEKEISFPEEEEELPDDWGLFPSWFKVLARHLCLIFALFSATKLFWITTADEQHPLTVSSNMRFFGCETNIPVISDPITFVLPHVLVAISIEIGLMGIYAKWWRRRDARMTLLLLTCVHCYLVWTVKYNLGGLGWMTARLCNLAPSALALLMALSLFYRCEEWCVHLLAISINFGPLGELATWPFSLELLP